MLSSSNSSGGGGVRRSKGPNSAAAAASANESEKRVKEIRAFQTSIPENKCCFDCGQRGPTYVNMTVGAFVCTKCSGMLRGINPPHRIKSLSMSSFSAEEVSFLRARGNVWAKKVYTGLYDHSRTSFDVKDDEGIKDFIIEKYEKKRYYVDPSTINISPPSSPQSQPSNYNGSSSTFGIKTTNLIGSTLNAKLMNNGSGRANSQSVVISRPPVNTNSKSHDTLNGNNRAHSHGLGDLSIISSVPAATITAAAASTPPAAATALTGMTNSSSSSSAAATDPFGGPPAQSSTKQTANKQSTEQFANFDAANFDSVTVNDPFAEIQRTTKAGIMPVQKQQQQLQDNKKSAPVDVIQSQADRYAALKDLDEIFKSSVAISEPSPLIAGNNSTGASLFGTSPIQPAAVIASAPAPPNVIGSQSPSQSQGFFEVRGNNANKSDQSQWPGGALGGQKSNWPSSSSSGNASQWPAGGVNDLKWPTESDKASDSNLATQQWPQQMSTTSSGGNNSSSKQWPLGQQHQKQNSVNNSEWAANWNDRNGVTSPPVNPFTGSSNLTQLNTSPWPTTGNSPVNSGFNSQPNSLFWNNVPSSTASSSQSKPQTDFNQQSRDPSRDDATQPDPIADFPDPFDTNNIQSSDNNNDLFANAPKPFSANYSEQDTKTDNFSRNAFENSDNGNNGNFQAFFDTMASSTKTISDESNSGNPWQQKTVNTKNPFL